MPVEDYLPGASLPPHLSPFVEVNEGSYVPPEKQRLIKMKLGIVDEEKTEPEADTKKPTNGNKKSQVENKENKSQVAETKKPVQEAPETDEEDLEENGMRVDLDSPNEESDDDDKDTEISESEDETKKTNEVLRDI